MIICSQCLEEKYKNWSHHTSEDRCRICDKVKLCHDIPSEQLRKKRTKTKEEELREEEIQYIYELLQACLEEEGYVIINEYADGNWEGFNVPLKNNRYTSIMEDNLFIKVKWS